jgi:hypothetical protein
MDLSESNTIDHHKDDKKCECNKCSVKCVSSLNMATSHHVTPNIKGPETFDGSEHKLEEFLISFNRYSKIMGLSEERKILLVTPYLTPDAILKYEKAPGSTCEEKMRAAFSKEKSILDLMKDLIELRVGCGDPSLAFRKADEIIEKLVEKKFGKKELSNLVYANMIDDDNVDQEIAIRGVTKADEIENIQMRMYEYGKKKRNSPIAAYNTRKENDWKTVENKRRTPKPRNNEVKRDSTSRNYKVRKIICWACHEEGHVRRECPNVKCSHCQRRGHLRTQCYENPNRFKERDQRKWDNNRNHWNDRRDYSNQRYRERPAYMNKKQHLAELDDKDDEMDRRSDMSDRREENTSRDYSRGKRRSGDEQGNEDARSQGEVISVLH